MGKLFDTILLPLEYIFPFIHDHPGIFGIVLCSLIFCTCAYFLRKHALRVKAQEKEGQEKYIALIDRLDEIEKLLIDQNKFLSDVQQQMITLRKKEGSEKRGEGL